MKIGFALITDSPFFDRVIDLEHAFHDEARFFDSLGSEKNLPHTTLFQGYMDDSIDYRAIADMTAKGFVRLVPDRIVRFKDIVYVPEGWYFLECVPDVRLNELHSLVLSAVKPFIQLDPARMDRNMEVLSPEELEGVRVYGYRYAAKAFYPHITIGRSRALDEPILKAMNEAVDRIERKTFFSRVTVYKMGNNGTHEATLYEVRL